MSAGFDDIADRLYALPPEEFTAARDEAVRAARSAGDRDLARAVGALRRPTVGGWLVNLLAHRRPDLIADLMALAQELRTAQRQLRGDDLRTLSARRRTMVGELSGQARALAVAAGRGVRDTLPLAEVESTLTAALADDAVADVVRLGRVVKTVAYAGFGELPRPQLRLLRGGDEPSDEPPATRPSAVPSPPPPTVIEREQADHRAAKETAAADLTRRIADKAAARQPDPAARADRVPGGGRRATDRVDAGPRSTDRADAGAGTTDRAEVGSRSTDRADAGSHATDGGGATRRATDRGGAGTPAAGGERGAPSPQAGRGEAGREAAARAERERVEQAELEAAELVAAERDAAEQEAAAHAAAERAAARRRTAAAHRDLLAARTELADAEAARVTAEQAVRAARRRVEAALAAVDAARSDS